MLKFEDYQQRKDFACAFLRLTNDETFFSHLIMSDEAHFHIDRYVYMCNKQKYRFWGVLIKHRLNMHDFWFQQDRATAHTAKETMSIPRAAFHGRIISRCGDFS